MPLGTQVDPVPGRIVLDGDPGPPAAESGQTVAHLSYRRAIALNARLDGLRCKYNIFQTQRFQKMQRRSHILHSRIYSRRRGNSAV